MAVTLRLTRKGAKKHPHFRMVAADSRYPRDGRFLEALGYYDPQATKDSDKVSINEDRVKFWLAKGAQLSDTVKSLLKQKKII